MISALGTNYVKFANGLLIQWGKKDSPSTESGGEGYANVTLPQAFIDTGYTVIATPIYLSSVVTFEVSAQAATKDRVYIYTRLSNGTSRVTGVNVFWIALGKWK